MSDFIAYGLPFTCGEDLEPWLCRSGAGRPELTVAESLGAGVPNLSECTPLFASHGREVTLNTDRSPISSSQGQPWRFEVEGVVSFEWRGGDSTIQYHRLDGYTVPLFAFWLIHIFLPLYFTLEGRFEFIHACSVEVNGKTILFIGPSHGGKSTLADFFLQQGHTLVSDDKVATYFQDGEYFAVPSHPNHRPYRRFEDLGYRVRKFDTKPRPVDAVYGLLRSEPDSEVTIQKITGHQSFAGMLPSYLFNFSFLKAKRLRYLGQMVNTVPVYKVSVPWDMERLSDLHDVICQHRPMI